VYTYCERNNLNTSTDRVEEEAKELDNTNIPITVITTATGSRTERGADDRETRDGSSGLSASVLYAPTQLVSSGDYSSLETGDIVVITATINGFNSVKEVGLEGD
jgi:hypothetical protein